MPHFPKRPLVAFAIALSLLPSAFGAARAQVPVPGPGPEMPFPFPFPLDPSLLEKLLGAGKKSVPPGPDEVAAVRRLQALGVPPWLHMIEPSDAAGKPVKVELYDLQPSSPTEVGRRLDALLKDLKQEEVRRISKKKLYVLLALLRDLAAEEGKKTADAFPEERDAIRRRLAQVLAMDVPEDKDFAGLGTDPKLLASFAAERRKILETLLSRMDSLPGTAEQKAAAKARLEREIGQLKTLEFDPAGKPLIPRSLFELVKAVPEAALPERQWRTLFYSYPMGRSLWDLRVDRLWRDSVSGKGVRVAILDTGIDREHPELAGVVDFGNFTSHRHTAEHKAESGNVYKVGDPDFRGEHGTHVASTVRALAPDAEILNIKVLDEEADNIPEERKNDMTQTITAIYDGLDQVLKHNRAVAAGTKKGEPIDVVSMSLGLPNSNTRIGGSARDLLSRKVKELADEGVIVVVAAGNEGNDTARRPGLEASAVTVGASDYFGRKASFSSNRSVVDAAERTLYDIPTVWAPGHDIWAAKYEAKGDYGDKDTKGLNQFMSGTSMATPHVAGVVALLVDAGRKEGIRLTPPQIQQLLKDSSDPLAGENPYARTGGGNINPRRALELMRERHGKQRVARAPDAAPSRALDAESILASAGPF